MRYLLILFIVFAGSLESANAQRWIRDRHHLIVGTGVSGFMGDLGGADQIGGTGINGIRDFNFGAVRPAFTVGYRYMMYQNLGITGNAHFGYVYGSDRFTDEVFRNNRNIHFRSPIAEISTTAQLYVIRLRRDGSRYRRVTQLRGWQAYGASAYLFAGIGGFYFNPQAYFERENYNGSIPLSELPGNGWYNLHPLRTEGQGYFPTRDNYNRFSVAIPFGIGGMIDITRNMSIGIEYGFRKTFTDYIDDVSTTYVDPTIFREIFETPSQIALAEYFANPTNNQLSKSVTAPGQQRGNPFNTDAYMFATISVYYRLADTPRRSRLIRF